MNTEQLQMIINAFGEASDGAFIIGLLYVLEGYVTFLAGLGLAAYAVKKTHTFVSQWIDIQTLYAAAGLKENYPPHRKVMREIVEAGKKALGR